MREDSGACPSKPGDSGKGVVYVVGAGPGDPELITIKGLRLIEIADVIVYDRLAPRELLRHAKKGAELVYAGKEPGFHAMSQDDINKLLLDRATRGLTVVRLKGGDPLVFGRGEEECLFLARHGVECIIVPGIPSFIGAAAYAMIPLTSRGYSSSFAVVTGKEAPEKGFTSVRLGDIARAVDTIIVLMGASRSPEIFEELIKVLGSNALGAVVINATRGDQVVIEGTLGELLHLARKGRIRNPAVIIVGKTVGLREKLCAESVES
ncbi:MAG: uroporphyrinogen-III C-methyltransferase [Desulfurococcales archaeon]|nr:uroporphyrinogen-III C-methyltransferase [Desulfurococcales archaeon]